MTKNSTIILIDGSNWYYKLKSLGFKSTLQLDYSRFINQIADGKHIVGCTYYVGKIRTDESKHSKQLHRKQQQLLTHLKKHKVIYKLGYLLKSNGVYHEKGVDVQMAVDILTTSYEKITNHIILISSDTDLIPAIRKARQLGTVVEYVGFAHQKSKALIKECTTYRLLTKSDFESL